MEVHMKNQFNMAPVKNYTTPNLPTLAESKNDTTMLKKLPNRWTKKAKVIARFAFVGTIAFAGCGQTHGNAEPPPPTEQVEPALQEALQSQLDAIKLHYRTHYGGAGGGPFYVVHITEQEALGIIRAKLEVAGLQLDATPPNNTVEFGWAGDIVLDLFDEEKGVAVSHLTWEINNQAFFSFGGGGLARHVAEEFAAQDNNITVGAFFNPGEYINASLRWWDWEDETYLPTAEEVAQTQAELKETLVNQLDEQVQEFINLLTSQGLIY